MKGAAQTLDPAADAISYRLPMTVTELIIRWNRDSHFLCPRCGITLEREFTAYCDRCGQCLNWKQYKRAKQIFPQGK